MILLNTKLSQKVLEFSERYVQAFMDEFEHLPVTEHDSEWPSPCTKQPLNEDLITWKPEKIEDSLTFSNIEQALELAIHPDIVSYFTTIYGDNMAAVCSEGHLSLLFPWSQQDFLRLQENIVGHILMKKKLKQDITVFFAVTDQDEYFLSINNQDGSVWVERVGCKPHKRLADSLAQFFDTLTPLVSKE
ncbi:SecY-interacting protein [Thalassotalea ganghwensis]